ncbi:MAG: amino acid decarboxylase [Thermoanaerobaculia bacterium]|nr:amino acid decarboxylase [Thermoanaerobaculia bacterium]
MLDQIRQFERAARALEPDASCRKKLRGTVLASTERFLRGIDTLPGYVEVGDPGRGLLDVPIGEFERSPEEVIELLETEVFRPGGNPASPGHLAYIPGGGLYHSALADFMAAVTDKYAGIFFTGPGPVQMENQVLRWVADLVGYPGAAGGNIASGGSLATLTAITTARHAHRLRCADIPSSVIYLTSQAHHCIEKALRVAGLGEAQIRYVAVDDRFRMRAEALAESIVADRRAGLRPWLIAAAAGTTDTGAVDPLNDIADIATRESCWFHVDAAYGGFFLLTEYGRATLRGIERSDSVILDPHKSMFLPWGAGIVLVRDVKLLLAAHGEAAETPSPLGSYLQDAQRSDQPPGIEVPPGEISPSDVSLELTKPFRALRLWLPLVMLGTGPFRAALDEKLLLARYFQREIAARGFVVGPEPDLSVVTFRWAPPGVDLEESNRLNQAIVDGLRRDGRIFLSSTQLDGRFTLRMAALGVRTHLQTIDQALRILSEQVAALTSAQGAEIQ